MVVPVGGRHHTATGIGGPGVVNSPFTQLYTHRCSAACRPASSCLKKQRLFTANGLIRHPRHRTGVHSVLFTPQVDAPGRDKRREMPTDAERLAACDAEVASHRAKFPDVAHIEPETLRQMQSDGPVLLVDVRSDAERAISTIPGALPLSKLPRPLPDDVPLVTFCTVGFRSALEARRLLSTGGEASGRAVYSMSGVLKWAHTGGVFVDAGGNPTRRLHVFGEKWQALAPSHVEAIIFSTVSLGLFRAVLRVPIVMLQTIGQQFRLALARLLGLAPPAATHKDRSS